MSNGLEAILVCSCSGMDKQAATSYSILFPDRVEPTIYKGVDKVRALADKHPGTNLERYLRGVVKQSGRWAYSVIADKNNNITELYDLITGRRVG